MVYFPRPLSKFRAHSGNEQLTLQSYIRGAISWALAIRDAIARQLFLRDADTRRAVITAWCQMASTFLRQAEAVPELWEDPEFQDLLTVFSGMSEALHNDCRITFDIDTTLVLNMDKD